MNHHGFTVRAVARIAITAMAVGSLLAACGSDPPSGASTGGASIDVSAVWARTSASVAGAGAVYLTINNRGAADDALVAATVDASIAESAGLHETVTVDASASTMAGGATPATGGSMMQMRPVDRIVVPAHGSVALAPGGYHVMMEGLAKPLTLGSTVQVTLTFETSGQKVVTADVRDTAP